MFWCGNALIIGVVISGANLRFQDPALSLLQMYWAAATSILALLFSSKFDIAVYLLLLLILVFGIFRVSVRQFNIIAVFVIVAMFIVHGLRLRLLETQVQPSFVLVQWATFSFCAFTLTRLCQSIVTLRNRLRQKNEELQEALDAKQKFLANMSHEIRTPMNGVLGTLDIVLRENIPQTQRRHLKIAQSSASSLLAIIDDILDFSKIEAGRLHIESVEFDLGQLMNEVTATLGAKAESRGIKLIVEVAPDTPAVIVTDPVRLRQILVNLVSNALKFTERGSVTVAVQPAKVDEAYWLQWQVCDTGIGIAEEHIDSLFESFTQADVSTTRLYGGTGLGLAICKQLCELLGGEIHVTSVLGEGSSFEFSLPVGLALEQGASANPGAASGSAMRNAELTQRDAEPTQHHEDQPAQELHAVGSVKPNAKILLVEDNPTNQEVAALTLEELGYQVDIAGNGQEAIGVIENAIAQGALYDLILMDCQMPVLDGYQASRKIRELPCRRLPIIAMTANAMRGDREKCVAAGMDDYIVKPIQFEVVQRKLAKWLERSRAQAKTPTSTNAPAHTTESVTRQTVDEARPADLICWDQEALRKLVRNKDERMHHLLKSFLKNIDATELEIIGALKAGEMAKAEVLVHNLKGASANLGARVLPAYLQQIETQLSEPPSEVSDATSRHLAELLAELKTEMSRVVDVRHE